MMAVHNGLTQHKPEWQYLHGFVDGSLSNCSVEHGTDRGTTGYTSLLDLGSREYVLLYDRLANSWNMPPGKAGDKDFTFSMRFSWRGPLKSDDEIRALVAKSNLKFSTIYGFNSSRQLQVGFTNLAVIGLSSNPASWVESFGKMDSRRAV